MIRQAFSRSAHRAMRISDSRSSTDARRFGRLRAVLLGLAILFFSLPRALAQNGSPDISALITRASQTARQARHGTSRVAPLKLPIGVFDSGTGGLAVFEAILTIDAFENSTRRIAAEGDGQADFANESFIYLADQANMPYGNYPNVGMAPFLESLVVKDAEFLLGNRYFPNAGSTPVRDKLPVKAIVIACNTATAYGKGHIEKLVTAAGLDIPVIGVVDAGARGAIDLFTEGQSGTIGVLATRGTVLAEAYPRAIRAEIERRNFHHSEQTIRVIQQGSLGLAGAIDGVSEFLVSRPESGRPRNEYQGPSFVHPLAPIDRDILARYGFEFSDSGMLFDGPQDRPTVLQLNSIANYVRYDLISLLESLRRSPDAKPLRAIILGCTHFPFYARIFRSELRRLANYREDGVLVYGDCLADRIELIDPAYYVARELHLRLAQEDKLLPNGGHFFGQTRGEFYISVPCPHYPEVGLNAAGQFTHQYKYSTKRPEAGTDYRVVPLRRRQLDAETANRLHRQLPAAWRLFDDFSSHNDKAQLPIAEHR